MASRSYIVIDPHNKVSLISHPDNFLIDTKSGYGIDVVRKLISWSFIKPFTRTYKIALVSQAHNFGVEAQNALLKTLEEPCPHTTLMLTTPQETMLLPTIVSRCEKINSIDDIPKNAPFATQLIIGNQQQSPLTFPLITSEKSALQAAEGFAKTDRTDVIAALEQWGSELAQHNPMTYSSTLLQLIETKKRIAANGNIQLNLEILFLHIAQNVTNPLIT